MTLQLQGDEHFGTIQFHPSHWLTWDVPAIILGPTIALVTSDDIYPWWGDEFPPGGGFLVHIPSGSYLVGYRIDRIALNFGRELEREWDLNRPDQDMARAFNQRLRHPTWVALDSELNSTSGY